MLLGVLAVPGLELVVPRDEVGLGQDVEPDETGVDLIIRGGRSRCLVVGCHDAVSERGDENRADCPDLEVVEQPATSWISSISLCEVGDSLGLFSALGF